MPEPGKRNDLLALKEVIDSGATMREISQQQFPNFVRYHRSILVYKAINAPERDWIMDVQVFWGPTGSGKSRRARIENPGAYWKSKNAGSAQYWDNYQGQDTIVVDEFYGWLSWDFMLRFLDSTPLQLDVKHGGVAMSAKKIVFTSNDHPSEWYSNARFPWGPDSPIKRRINSIIFIGNEQYGDEDLYLRARNSENERRRLAYNSGDTSEDNRLNDLYLKKFQRR